MGKNFGRFPSIAGRRRAARMMARDRAESALYRVATAANERLSTYWRGQPEQLALHLGYREGLHRDDLPGLDDVGFRVYSQFDEDGMLLYLLSLVGMGSRRCIDIGCGFPMGSNTTNLIVNWRFDALRVDGDPGHIARGNRWFRRNRDTMFRGPRSICSVVAPDNVNTLLAAEGFGDDVDLLSLDIDGVDYWVWDAMEVTPRVVVVEFNASLPAGRALTVPPRPPITTVDDMRAHFYGASLDAFVELARRRGYRFVGVSAGPNAFFVHESAIPVGTLSEPDVAAALDRPGRAIGRGPPDAALLTLPWLEL